MGAMLKYGSEGAKQFNVMFVLKPEHAEAHRDGRHPHPRHGLSHADHHLLPDRPASSCSRAASPPATAICASRNDIAVLCGAGLHRHPGQPERPARRPVASSTSTTPWPRACAKTFAQALPRQPASARMELKLRHRGRGEGRPRHRSMRLRAQRADAHARAGRRTTATPRRETLARRAACRAGGRRARCRRSPHKNAVAETDRATYQAMEALDPQPQHHALPRRRAGRRSRPSTTAWTPRPEGAHGHPQPAAGARRRAWATARRPSSPSRSSASRRASTTIPASPNYDLFKLAMRVLGEAAVPQLLLPGRALQPAILQGGPPGDGDRLHGLPHARDGQRVRPGAARSPTAAAT